ncbi:transporter substrate-binding domain-containing protein [Labrenzia sp. OB1]|uniref:substrate-binding periplasmic protein n=1 Tax=Labrenzia sp. OB1 TaxID=1561204 RepID=UPI0007B3103E|nr:transporter substrate-binding domain-containing protein [Labrenzia sp. OB1]KZM49266.1 amino acid ABC transporter substrate-binding protein [Labrenzia sp. OB1]
MSFIPLRYLSLFLVLAASAFPVKATEMLLATDKWSPGAISVSKSKSGPDVDLIREIARRSDADLKVAQMPWGRGLASMQSGAVDVMTGLAYRAEQAEYIVYTDMPYSKCRTAFYALRGVSQEIRGYPDLSGRQIGYVLHSAHFDRFDKDATLNKVGVPAEQTLLDMLLKRRIAVVIGTDCQFDYYIKEQGLASLVEKAPYSPGAAVDLFLGVSRKSVWARRIDVLNSIIRDLGDEGYLDRIAREYSHGPS